MFSTKGVERSGRNKEGGSGRILKPFHNLLFQIQVPSSCFSLNLRMSRWLKGWITHRIAAMFVLSVLWCNPQSRHSHLCFGPTRAMSGQVSLLERSFSMNPNILHNLYLRIYRSLSVQSKGASWWKSANGLWESACHLMTEWFTHHIAPETIVKHTFPLWEESLVCRTAEASVTWSTAPSCGQPKLSGTVANNCVRPHGRTQL